MRPEVVSCWISDVSEACHNVPEPELDIFVWKPDSNQQTQADTALTSLVWCHRPQRKGLGATTIAATASSTIPGHGHSNSLSHAAIPHTSSSSPINAKRDETPASTSPPLYSNPFTSTAAIRITPSPDPDIFPDPEEIGIATTAGGIAAPVGLQRGRSTRALRQQTSQSSVKPGGVRSQSAALSSLRKEFISHEELRRRGSPSPGPEDLHSTMKPRPIPPRLYASLHNSHDDSGSNGTMGSHIITPMLNHKSHLHITRDMASSVGNAHSMGTLLDLDDDDEDDVFDQDEEPIRSVVDSGDGSGLYSHQFHPADNLSRSHHPASSEVLAPTKSHPRIAPGANNSTDALAPSQVARPYTRTTTRTNIRSPTPNDPPPPPPPSHPIHRPVPLRTVLETLEKPLRWDDSTHDIRLRTRALVAQSPKYHGLSELIKAIIASSGDYHTCKLPQEVAPLFDDDEDVPPDAFASTPFDAIDALPGLEESLRIHVSHNQYAHSMVSLQTAAAMAVLQHSQIADIVSATHRCRDTDSLPQGWGDSVYAPLLRLAIGPTKGIHPENTAGATMLPSVTPHTLRKALPIPPPSPSSSAPSPPTDPLPLMLDYALTISLGQLSTATGNQLQRELLSLIRRRATPETASINHSLYGPLTKSPIAAFIRTATTAAPSTSSATPGVFPPSSPQLPLTDGGSSAGAGAAAALAQLCLSATSWYRHIGSFCECTFQKECCTGPPFVPLLRVAGDAWAVAFVVNGEEDFEVLPTVNVGSTETVTGTYRLLESLRHVVEWVKGDYLDWLTDFLSHHS